VRAVTLILASASPRREALLAGLGVPFEVLPSRIAENEIAGGGAGPVPGAAAGIAVELARRKAEDVAVRLGSGGAAGRGAPRGAGGQPSRPPGEGPKRRLVVGADTVVTLPGRVLGKPSSAAEAREMLEMLSGREHRVVTGVAVVDPAGGRSVAGAEETRVFFRNLTRAEIQAYVESGEPMDKAGAYAVQGLGALLVERIEGCYFNVVGLPLGLLAGLLGEFGYDLLARSCAAAAARRLRDGRGRAGKRRSDT